MAVIPIKVILLEKGEKLGTGLTALRTKESEAIDITDYEVALSDATSASGYTYFVKDNKAYAAVRNYLDLDRNIRFIIARNEGNSFDRWPVS